MAAEVSTPHSIDDESTQPEGTKYFNTSSYYTHENTRNVRLDPETLKRQNARRADQERARRDLTWEGIEFKCKIIINSEDPNPKLISHPSAMMRLGALAAWDIVNRSETSIGGFGTEKLKSFVGMRPRCQQMYPITRMTERGWTSDRWALVQYALKLSQLPRTEPGGTCEGIRINQVLNCCWESQQRATGSHSIEESPQRRSLSGRAGGVGTLQLAPASTSTEVF